MKTLALLLLTFSLSFGLNSSQKNKIEVAYKIGKTIKAKDGMTFENTLPSIMGQESSWGVYLIGDKIDSTGRLKSLYDSSLGNFQIKLSTAKLTIIKYPNLTRKYGYMVNTGKSTYKEYKEHHEKLKYYNNILRNEKWINRAEKGEKEAIKTLSWAKEEYLYHYTFFDKSKAQARQDTMLINALMNNFEVGAEISGHYLLSMYEEASRKFGKKEAYWRAIGRYNGGWHNKTYYEKVKSRMKTVVKLMKGKK